MYSCTGRKRNYLEFLFTNTHKSSGNSNKQPTTSSPELSFPGTPQTTPHPPTPRRQSDPISQISQTPSNPPIVTLWSHSPHILANCFFHHIVLTKSLLLLSIVFFLGPFQVKCFLFHTSCTTRPGGRGWGPLWHSSSHPHIVPPSSAYALHWSSNIRLTTTSFYGIYFFWVTLPHLLKILSPGLPLPSSGIIFGDFNIKVNYSWYPGISV